MTYASLGYIFDVDIVYDMGLYDVDKIYDRQFMLTV